MSHFFKDKKLQEMLAIAIAYQTGTKDAPEVIASGKGEIARKIVEVAQSHGIPIEENSSLAAIISMVEIGDTIPADVFVVMAEIISRIYRIGNTHQKT